jgi:hypothetical protein
MGEEIDIKLQQAFTLLEEAERHEKSEEWSNAIYKYQQASELLSKCGLPRAKIEEVYDRIAHLKKLNEQKGQTPSQINAYDLQTQAFSLIDTAKSLEKSGQYEQCAETYMNAVKMLLDAGWDEAQLQGFKDEVQRVVQKAQFHAASPPIQSSIQPNYSENQTGFDPSSSNQTGKYFAQKKHQVNQKQTNIDELQSQAFRMIDFAKVQEKEEKFEESIENYMQAIQLLIQAGWDTSQLEGFQSEIQRVQQKLVSSRASVAALQSKQKYGTVKPPVKSASGDGYVPTFAQVQQEQPKSSRDLVLTQLQSQVNVASKQEEFSATVSQIDSAGVGGTFGNEHKAAVQFLQMQKKYTEDLEKQAFNLLDEAKRSEHDKNYEVAVMKYLSAADMLNKLGWTSLTTNIYEAVEVINKKKLEDKARSMAKVAIPIQVQKTEEIQSPVVITIFNMSQFEVKRSEEDKIQSEAFELINSAEKKAANKNFDEAIADYNHAIVNLNKIGWQGYTPKIQSVIEELIKQKELYEKNLDKLLRGQEVVTNVENEVVSELLDKELETRRAKLQEFDKVKEKQKNLQDLAFSLIEEGQEAVNNSEFDEALRKYNQAIELLISVGWQDQIQQLNVMISNIQSEKVKTELGKQQERIQRIQREKQEAEFKEKLAAKVSAESGSTTTQARVDYTKVQDHQQKKAKAQEIESQALELLDEAKRLSQTIEPDYDQSLAIYQQAYSMLSEVGWTTELGYIKSMIDNIKQEKSRREQEIIAIESMKQKTIEEHEQFQENLKTQMESFDTVKEQQLTQLKQFQEQRDSEKAKESIAFELMNEGSRLADLKNYVNSIEYYKKAAEIFSEINWGPQLSYIQHEIERLQSVQEEMNKELKLRLEMQMKAEQDKVLAKQKLSEQQKKEKDELSDISSMIKSVAKKKEEEKTAVKIMKEEEKHLYDAQETKRSEQKEQLLSLRDSIKSALQTKQKEIVDEKSKIKDDLQNFRDMIHSAALTQSEKAKEKKTEPKKKLY